MALPFWPSSESAQFGPNVASSFGAWQAETTALYLTYECQNMTLESADLSPKYYSNMTTVQGYGPINGTQPMVTFVLVSGDSCRYELISHPAVNLAAYGGVTWSNASTYLLTTPAILPMGGRMYVGGVGPNSMFARINASDQCAGRDILTINTPWAAPLDRTSRDSLFLPTNQTYTRSPNFRMRAVLCDSKYTIGKQVMNMSMSGSNQHTSNILSNAKTSYKNITDNIINISQFQAKSMQDNMKSYIDQLSTLVYSLSPTSDSNPSYSGMTPLLTAASNYNLLSMLDDPNIIQRAASMKGQFFMETVREAFENRDLMETNVIVGEAIVVENRVVVLTEMGFTLAALFFAISILILMIFWTSRLLH
jgi:hypothetical protein